jgi:hypothetical protein
MSEYAISISEDERNLLTGSLLNLKADLIEERADYEDVSELLEKLRNQRPAKKQSYREAR